MPPQTEIFLAKMLLLWSVLVWRATKPADFQGVASLVQGIQTVETRMPWLWASPAGEAETGSIHIRRALRQASASRLGNRRLRMRRWRPLAAPRPRVVLHARRYARLSAPLSLPRARPRSLAAPFIRVQRAHASAPLGRLRGEIFRLHVRARAALRTRTLAGGQGPRRRCTARTSTTVPARL